jgi:hypothetical protein
LLAAPGSAGAQEPEVVCFGETPTMVGTDNADTLRGTSGHDVIDAGAGNDVVRAGGGDDIICGGAGDDQLSGGPGDDKIFDETGDDIITGGDGNDLLSGQLGDDVMRGGAGDDALFGGNGDEEDFTPGADELYGGPGNDFLSAGPGDDYVNGGAGDDQLLGGLGDDELRGAGGNDTLNGDFGDDQLYGGSGDDLLDGGPGVDVEVGGSGTDTVVRELGLADFIAAGDRDGIRTWAADKTIAQLNAEVAALDATQRDQLAAVVLDTNATGEDRDKMLRVLRTVLADADTGFYAEIWSYTFVELTGDGFFGTCNHLFLSPSSWTGLSDADALGILVHETFHSFDCVNGGPAGSLDEGAAIWVYKSNFAAALNPGETWAEATYGTKLFYRDIQGVPDFPLGAAAAPTQKLLDEYAVLAAHDPSQLPWNSTDRLVTCFDRYYAGLDRNVDFFTVWLPSVDAATQRMLADPGCKPL